MAAIRPLDGYGLCVELGHAWDIDHLFKPEVLTDYGHHGVVYPEVILEQHKCGRCEATRLWWIETECGEVIKRRNRVSPHRDTFEHIYKTEGARNSRKLVRRRRIERIINQPRLKKAS